MPGELALTTAGGSLLCDLWASVSPALILPPAPQHWRTQFMWLSHLMAPSLNFLICTVGINTATPWEVLGRSWCPQGPCRHRGLLPPPPARVPASWASRALSMPPPPQPRRPRKSWAAVRGGAQEVIKPAPAEAETNRKGWQERINLQTKMSKQKGKGEQREDRQKWPSGDGRRRRAQVKSPKERAAPPPMKREREINSD